VRAGSVPYPTLRTNWPSLRTAHRNVPTTPTADASQTQPTANLDWTQDTWIGAWTIVKPPQTKTLSGRTRYSRPIVCRVARARVCCCHSCCAIHTDRESKTLSSPREPCSQCDGLHRPASLNTASKAEPRIGTLAAATSVTTTAGRCLRRNPSVAHCAACVSPAGSGLAGSALAPVLQRQVRANPAPRRHR